MASRIQKTIELRDIDPRLLEELGLIIKKQEKKK